jgi:hypothetical protein
MIAEMNKYNISGEDSLSGIVVIRFSQIIAVIITRSKELV